MSIKPQFFEVNTHPDLWTLKGMPFGAKVDVSAVSILPWKHCYFEVGDVFVTGREV